jgi:trehalose synthase
MCVPTLERALADSPIAVGPRGRQTSPVFQVGGLWKQGGRAVDIVRVNSESLDRFASVLNVEEYGTLLRTADLGKTLLAGRTVWNVTSTARGGGVAEMLTSLLPLIRGASVDARWLVIEAEEEFFRMTKRIHNRLHGDPGDGGELGVTERAIYETVLDSLARPLAELVAPTDLVILHDPQTAGLAPALRRTGAKLIWRCHIGVDVPNALVESAWRFLEHYLRAADCHVFSRLAYAWQGLPRKTVVVIPPSIDIFAPKNEHLTPDQVSSILVAIGLVEGTRGDARFVRVDGSIDTVTRKVDLTGGSPVPSGARIITQISRWDRLKDPLGLVQGFASHVAPYADAHLVVAGPSVGAVSDDPEGFEALAETRGLWSSLDDDVRDRIHLVCLPMQDSEENAAMVNALQRRAAIVVQKSLAEGFGLTVAEAMWKERPIVASSVGGIQDQLSDETNGLLIDPRNLAAFGRAVLTLLENRSFAAKLGRAAHDRCREEYLAPKHLTRYVSLFKALLSTA